ncbi:MAG: YgeY family selenium metabolism-linked hydrolase [Chloroflexota bacterium]|nr:YgeY family selenium metabolism-linked hydrolase [Chloroflexota bacterium]MDE2853258.1 YgeY family selenium metabolism-linked hydrolase [Chloroflexota bacterium]MDE2948165.1 YgeY family selenium metabolism-linked hydrolase [Chloroflexota bacterium]
MVDHTRLQGLRRRVEAQRSDIITFLREICAIPSMENQIRACGERIAAEMERLGYDKIFWDKMGNIVGVIGDGDKVLLYDSHIDTVGIGDPDEWSWDPFEGKIENGILFARGACDEKGSTPGMVYGLALARELGLLDGFTAYYFGNMEEWNDGQAPHAFVQTEGVKPDFVVIGEPTKMQIYRGHKGRVEFKIVAKGKSAHAASNYLGDNAIYKLLPIIERISHIEPELGDHDFLGQGRITVTDMEVKTPSINAVPDEATIYVDRRITFGEEPAIELQRLRAIIGERDDIRAEILVYDEPSYTGFVFPLDKIYPAWAFEKDEPIVKAGLSAAEVLYGQVDTGKWDFSTNGIYWAGKAGIPSIGFAPGNEIHAHTVLDQVPLEDVVRSTEWYALFPAVLRQTLNGGAER